MKTVGELIHSLDLANVLAALKSVYTGEGESEEGYRLVWSKLKAMQPQNSSVTVLLSRRGGNWIDVSGLEPGDSQHYAIEFVDWAQWLSMPIKVAPELGAMREAEQLAHCLYEMTFMGYDQADIAENLEDIHDSVEEIKAMTEEERKSLPTFPSSQVN